MQWQLSKTGALHLHELQKVRINLQVSRYWKSKGRWQRMVSLHLKVRLGGAPATVEEQPGCGWSAEPGQA